MTVGEHSVKIIKDTFLEFPELWMDIYVAGDEYEERAFASLFSRAACKRASTPLEADLVIFTGGPDVNPALYGETPHKTTRWCDERDQDDIALFSTCYEEGIPMLGVCRGAQFLYTMLGGKLIQDVTNHNGNHRMWDKEVRCFVDPVSSVHHQMCAKGEGRTAPGIKVLAEAAKITEREYGDGHEKGVGFSSEIEAFWHPETCILGVQGHPEYQGYESFAKWTLDKINQYIVCNPDVKLVNNVRRLDPDFIAMREEEREKNASTVG